MVLILLLLCLAHVWDVDISSAKDGPYLVGTTPGPVNEAWLEKVLGQHQAPGYDSHRAVEVLKA